MNPQAQLTIERRLLLNLLGSRNEALDRPGFVSLLHQTNWPDFLAIASQDLYPYLASRLEPYVNCIEPPREWEVLFNARRLAAVHNLRLRHELGRVVQALGKSGIAALALKGIVLAYTVYQDSSLRSMADLDVLVPAEKKERALDILQELGFEYPGGADTKLREHSFRLAPSQEFAFPLRLRGSKVLLEVHSQLECSDPVLPVPVEEFWLRSVTVDLGGFRAHTLCPEDFLFHLCLHASRGHRFETGLRSLIDLRVFLDSCADWDWASIAARSIRHQCAPWMYLTLAVARDFVGAPVPELFFQSLPRLADLSSLRRLAEEQIWSAHCGPRLPLLPTLLAEPSWRIRTRMFLTRMQLVRRGELGSGPIPVRLIRLARLSWRRLLATLKIVRPRFLRALQGGQWKVGAVWTSARLIRQSNTLFRMLEEAGISQSKVNSRGAQSPPVPTGLGRLRVLLPFKREYLQKEK
jgi:hypothetical protein